MMVSAPRWSRSVKAGWPPGSQRHRVHEGAAPQLGVKERQDLLAPYVAALIEGSPGLLEVEGGEDLPVTLDLPPGERDAADERLVGRHPGRAAPVGGVDLKLQRVPDEDYLPLREVEHRVPGEVSARAEKLRVVPDPQPLVEGPRRREGSRPGQILGLQDHLRLEPLPELPQRPRGVRRGRWGGA